MAFEFESRLPRRRFLAGAACALALPRLRAQQEPAAYGLTALLDGSGMVHIRAGEFRMGSASGEADEAPVHRVRISQDFEIGKFEVSQALGERVLLPAVRSAAPETILVTDGFSCREQIRQNSPRHALHLAEVLAGRC